MQSEITEQLAERMSAICLSHSNDPTAELHASSVSTINIVPPPEKQRLTREDIGKLPRSIRKTHTKEDLNAMFDVDGFMYPFIQTSIHNGSTSVVSRRPNSLECDYLEGSLPIFHEI